MTKPEVIGYYMGFELCKSEYREERHPQYNYLGYSARRGDCCIWDSTIKIANNYKGRPQSDGSKVNTFYHELTQLILDTMGEFELSTNEKFVSTFSSFLTGALKTFDYGSDR